MGFPALARAGKATVQRILKAQELQPHKVRSCLERRDPEFERKMREAAKLLGVRRGFFTNIRPEEEFVFLAAILDGSSRRVIGGNWIERWKTG